MHSLERTYPNVYSKAVPGLAIPLLEDGCAETTVDIDWIKEALHFRSDETAQGIGDMTKLHEEISAWFEEDHLRAFLKVGTTDTENIGMEWLARAGKRWRPFLAVSIYKALAGENDAALPDKVKSMAIAVECIHKASLAYDDIQDSDDVRYGEETLFKKHGIPVALTSSLLLLGLGYRLLSTCEASDKERADMLALATGGHCELCLGQGSELNWARTPRPLTVDEVLTIFRFKTAPSFDVVFRLGAICAGADSRIHDILKHYSLDIGVAYQVQDDIDDFHGRGDVDDVACGRPSIVLALAYESADAEGKDIIARAWCDASANVLAEARQIIEDTGAEKKATEILERYRKQALDALKPLKNRDLKIILYRLAGKILKLQS
jgi:geranylgeranyl pyrophosphate synthase